MPAELWKRLELRHLVALHAVVEEGSFAGAAERLDYTQSAISQQIAMLEAILGARVLRRGNGHRRAQLTPVGVTLAEHARAIVARLQAVQADIADTTDGASPLRIGSYESIAIRILPTLLRRFREQNPGASVRLEQRARDSDLFGMLAAGELDFVFATLPDEAPGLAMRELVRDPFVLVAPAASPLAHGDGAVPIAALHQLPLIRLEGCSRQSLLDECLQAHGVEPELIFASEDNGVVQSFVAAGVGCALVPRLTMDPAMDATRLLELAGGPPPRRLGLVWSDDRLLGATPSAFVSAATAPPEHGHAARMTTYDGQPGR